MSRSADHLVVPYSTFLERREHLATLAAALRERDSEDGGRGAVPEKNVSADPELTSPTGLPPELATRAPR